MQHFFMSSITIKLSHVLNNLISIIYSGYLHELLLPCSALSNFSEVRNKLMENLNLRLWSKRKSISYVFFFLAAIVKLLLDHDSGLSKTLGPSNATLLITAACRGHTEVVKELLQRDPTLLELTRSNGKNALHFAVRQGHLEIVQTLLQMDPQLARKADNKGQTSLHLAAKGRSAEVVKLLLHAVSAIVMLPDKKGNTALHVATRKKRVEVLFFLSSLSFAFFCFLFFLSVPIFQLNLLIVKVV